MEGQLDQPQFGGQDYTRPGCLCVFRLFSFQGNLGLQLEGTGHWTGLQVINNILLTIDVFGVGLQT